MTLYASFDFLIVYATLLIPNVLENRVLTLNALREFRQKERIIIDLIKALVNVKCITLCLHLINIRYKVIIEEMIEYRKKKYYVQAKAM